VGIDRDRDALAAAGERLAPFSERIHLVQAVYDELPEVLESLRITSVSSVLLDLGVSSLQLDEVQRGFAYARNAPLDMRMDQAIGATAADIVNSYSPGDLARVLRDYGEERFARRIVSAIVRARAKAPLSGTAELAELVRAAVPAATRRTGGHPAKRTFQALRIEVNRELDALRAALPAALDALAPGGRIAVLAYHSLEDRLVKRALADGATPDVPPDMPVIPASAAPTLRLLTRGAERPSDPELEVNPRAASARLRAAERIVQVAA
jgi:16S rRNA (cytosine1402-N4)-methyltransferase